MTLLSNPALWAAAVAAVPATAVGVLGYRRARHVDSVAEQAGIRSSQADSIGQVVAGQNTMIANLQEDNRSLRDRVKELTSKLDQIIKECEELKRQVAILSLEVQH